MSSERHAIFLATVRAVAKDCGYAIAVHGSEKRDLDLVAVPWAVEAVSAHALVDALCAIVPLVVREEPWPFVPSPEPKPWGRLGWSLHGCPDHQYVDLSVAPRAGDAVPVVHWRDISSSKPPVTSSGSAVPARDSSPRERDRRDHEGTP